VLLAINSMDKFVGLLWISVLIAQSSIPICVYMNVVLKETFADVYT